MKTFTIKQRNGTIHTVNVDDSDYDEVMEHKWGVCKIENTYYVQRAIHLGYIKGKQKQKTILLHRQLLGITDPKIFADHRDHNGLNNQRENLRVATNRQNQFNRKPDKTSKGKPVSSIYKGVYWDKSNSKWRSQIMANGKRKSIGQFEDEYEAHLAYEKAAKEVHGEFQYKK
jgi:hypothetical protein